MCVLCIFRLVHVMFVRIFVCLAAWFLPSGSARPAKTLASARASPEVIREIFAAAVLDDHVDRAVLWVRDEGVAKLSEVVEYLDALSASC